ncbi:MAG: serine/threonine protein kinase [Alphaproteobacteria bacterium]|nr:serine/threonine protein kinase [Alphaproteobacteria bacterium]
MAVVYRAVHATRGTTHALKVLKTDDPRALERSLQELRVMAQLHHDNIAGISDLVTFGAGSGLVMEYVTGGSLEQLLRHTRPTPAQVDHLAYGVLSGVAAAHAHRVVHRDLKPANILLDVQGDSLVPKIADFGLAKVRHVPGHQGPRTFVGTQMGSPAYMAPEQFEDAGEVDEAADLFACGAVLYELVSGERAYGGRDPIRIYRDMLAGHRPPLPDAVPARIRQALDAALAPTPEDRPASAAALIDLWFDGQPPDAPVAFEPDVLERVFRDGRGSVDITLTPPEDREVSRVPLAVVTGLGLLGGALAGALVGGVALLALIGILADVLS